MILILTMAGRYTRFVAEGYLFPKYLLPWSDKTILSTIIYEMKKGDAFSDLILVANIGDEIYMPHVRAIMRSYDIDIHNLFLIHDTEGQAETALMGINNIEKNKGELKEPIVFHNIDTILYKRNFEEIKQSVEHPLYFLSSDITLDKHSDTLWISNLFARKNFANWTDSGMQSIIDNSIQKVSEILDNYAVEPLDVKVMKEIESIVERSKKRS